MPPLASKKLDLRHFNPTAIHTYLRRFQEKFVSFYTGLIPDFRFLYRIFKTFDNGKNNI
jgi:hypothetical protein